MSIRIYVSSPVSPAPGIWRANAEQYMTQAHRSWIPSNEDGTPASPWVLSSGGAPNWTAANADPDMRQLFPIPATIATRAALYAYLKNTSMSDLTPAQRAATLALVDSLGIYRADLVPGISLSRALRRVIFWLMEDDPGFADIWVS